MAATRLCAGAPLRGVSRAPERRSRSKSPTRAGAGFFVEARVPWPVRGIRPRESRTGAEAASRCNRTESVRRPRAAACQRVVRSHSSQTTPELIGARGWRRSRGPFLMEAGQQAVAGFQGAGSQASPQGSPSASDCDGSATRIAAQPLRHPAESGSARGRCRCLRRPLARPHPRIGPAACSLNGVSLSERDPSVNRKGDGVRCCPPREAVDGTDPPPGSRGSRRAGLDRNSYSPRTSSKTIRAWCSSFSALPMQRV